MSAWEVVEVVWYTLAAVGVGGLFVYEAFIGPSDLEHDRRKHNDNR